MHPSRCESIYPRSVGSPLQSGSSLQTARWLWQARQRAVRKFSADKLARIVRIILQGLPVLTAAGGLSWHNLFLSIPRPSSPSPFFFLFPPLSLSLLFPLLFSFFSYLVLFEPVRQHRLWLARAMEPLETRSSWNREGEAGRMRHPMAGITLHADMRYGESGSLARRVIATPR